MDAFSRRSCFIFSVIEKQTPPLSGADVKDGAFDLIGTSVDGGQPVVGYIVPDGMGEVDGLTIIDG
jgi:hypothetical protein